MQDDSKARGREARVPSEIPARGWGEILARVWREIAADNILLVAAGATFYLLLAIFPAAAAFVSLYGLFLDLHDVPALTDSLRGVLADDATAILRTQLDALASQEPDTLTFSFLLSLSIALWSANSGTKAVIEALNIAYEEKEKRSFLRLTLVALAFTLGAMAVAALMVVAVAVVPALLAFLHLDDAADLLLRLTRWPILLVVIATWLAVLYRYAPSRRAAKWSWVTWGSGLATLVWLAMSIGFTIYLERFANYNATYGSLGAVVGLMLWIWLSMTIVLVGAELNAEMERQTAVDTTRPPDKPMGRRGARVADTVAD